MLQYRMRQQKRSLLWTKRPRKLRDPLAKLYQEKGLAPLSITGIVPVKVSAENGPIVPGDLF